MPQRRSSRRKQRDPSPTPADIALIREQVERMRIELQETAERAEKAENALEELSKEAEREKEEVATQMEAKYTSILNDLQERIANAHSKEQEARDNVNEVAQKLSEASNREQIIISELQKANTRAANAEFRAAEELERSKSTEREIQGLKQCLERSNSTPTGGQVSGNRSEIQPTRLFEVPKGVSPFGSLDGNNRPTPCTSSNHQSGNIALPLPRQSEYDGKQSWDGYIKQFRGLAAACQWTEEERRFRLISSLRGDAANYAFTDLDEEVLHSSDLLERALEQRFGERKTSNAFLPQLEARRIGPKESLTEYTADIRRLVLKGYPTADEGTRETLALRFFIKGLNDPQMVMAVGMKEPSTIEDARTAAETYLSLKDEAGKGQTRPIRTVKQDMRGDNESQSPAVPNNAMQEMLTAFDQRMKELLDLVQKSAVHSPGNKSNRRHDSRHDKPRPTYNKSRNSQVTCWTCNETGHISRYCPQTKVEESDKGKSVNANTEVSEN